MHKLAVIIFATVLANASVHGQGIISSSSPTGDGAAPEVQNDITAPRHSGIDLVGSGTVSAVNSHQQRTNMFAGEPSTFSGGTSVSSVVATPALQPVGFSTFAAQPRIAKPSASGEPTIEDKTSLSAPKTKNAVGERKSGLEEKSALTVKAITGQSITGGTGGGGVVIDILPEPSAIALTIVGATAVVLFRRKRA